MSAALPAALFAMGLASGVHCVAMCGGIAAGFSAQRPLVRASELAARQLFFNAGRIATYGMAGALAGALGSAGAYMAGALPVQAVLQVFLNVVLLGVGLHLLGLTGVLAKVESAGAPLWRLLQPLAARLLSARTPAQVFAFGAVWGWLPCGLVYGALAVAVFSADPAQGALAMVAFGLGTLPWLLAAGVAAARLRGGLSRRAFRQAGGALLLGFGAWGLARADGLSEAVRQTILCLPAMGGQ